VIHSIVNMGIELAQHLSRLLRSKANQSLSISGDNHKAHGKASLEEETITDSTEFSTNGEEDDVVPEMFTPINCLSFAFHIVSDNPRSHTRPHTRSHTMLSDSRSFPKSRLVQSTSAPVLHKKVHRSFGSKHDSGRRRGTDAHSQNARWSPTNGKTTTGERTGPGGMKIPSRSKLDKPAKNAGWDDQGSRNASWDQPASKLQGLQSDKGRLMSLGLSGLGPKNHKDKYGAGATGNLLSPKCRWSIPQHSSDSMLVHPKRQRDAAY
jgi:hypothetical protein